MYTIKQIIEDVSRIDWGRHHDGAPPEYQKRVFELLWGTCAVESGFRHRRQIGFSPDTETGAFGLFQTELGSINQSMKYLEKNEWVKTKVNDMVLCTGVRIGAGPQRELLKILQTPAGDLHSCILARLHYLRVPHRIPADLQSQARYWLIWYNGKGATKKFIQRGHHTPKDAERLAIAQYMNAYLASVNRALDIGVTF